MSAALAPAGDLIPIGTRLRWMLLLRGAVTAIVPAGLLVDSADHDQMRTVLLLTVPWFVLTLPTLLLGRAARTVSLSAFNVSMFGDGLLLCLLWRALGGLDGPGGHLIFLHCAAVTLLTSFRAGVKLAVWQGLLALVTLEATAAGVWGPAVPFRTGDLVVYQATLLTTVLAAAAFAAVNEREVRRRRFDSGVLRRLAADLAVPRTAAEIAGLLADAGTRQLIGARAVVLAYRRDPGTGAYGSGLAVRQTRGADVVHLAAPADLPRLSVAGRALARGRTRLVTHLDPGQDPWLATQLPDARNLVVVPYAVDRVAGVLVLEAPRVRLGRVEHRVQDAAEHATALAAAALARAALLEDLAEAERALAARSDVDAPAGTPQPAWAR
jgi:two-component system, cell cycle response regulator